MTLAFSTHINGAPTNFVEKIWEGILRNGIECSAFELKEKLEASMNIISNYRVGTYNPKLHTIREDRSSRWREGKLIHSVIHNRTSKRFQFAPVFKCISIQEIEIKYKYEGNKTTATVIVENKIIGQACWINCMLSSSSSKVDKLAINDGFENTNDFFEYFSKDFTGKIIHWTPKKY